MIYDIKCIIAEFLLSSEYLGIILLPIILIYLSYRYIARQYLWAHTLLTVLLSVLSKVIIAKLTGI